MADFFSGFFMQEKQIEFSTAIGKEPNWLKEYRQKNFELLEKMPLKKSKYTEVDKTWQKIKEINSEENAIEIKAKGIQALSWEQAIKEKEEILRSVLEKEGMPSERTEALVNATFSSGIVVLAGKNFSKKELIEIELNATKNCIAKNLFIFEENCEINILEKISAEKGFLLDESVFLEQNSQANICRIHSQEENTVLNQNVFLGKDARMINSNAWLSAKQTKSFVQNKLIGQGAAIQQLDFLLGKEKEFLDLNLHNIHVASDATSYSLFKAVLEQQSKSIFDGMIKILPSGQRANALLEAHSMLLSDEASSNNIPGLEIEADDVKATHSASVAQLEEEHLFYLQAKGIEEKKAKKLVTESFLESVIIKMPEQFHEKISLELQKKLESDLE